MSQADGFPEFNGFLQPANPESIKENPLAGVPFAGNFEKDAASELTVLKSAFAQRAEAENRRKLQAIDSEYWLCLCFQTREQKEAFIAALKLNVDSDKYIDGRKLAQALAVELPASPEFSEPRVDKSWLEFCD